MVYIDPAGNEIDSTDIPGWLAEIDAALSQVPGTVDATAWPAGSPDGAYVAPWAGQLGDTAIDPATGIEVPLDPNGSGIEPAFEDPFTHKWTVNPQWVAYQESLGNVVTKPDLSSVPQPDPPLVFSGTNPFPHWADVYQWQTDTAKAENAWLAGLSAVNGDMVARSVDVAMGTTTKALSGYIDRAFQAIASLSLLTRTRIDNLQVATYVLAANVGKRLDAIEEILKTQIHRSIVHLREAIVTETLNRKTEIDLRIAQEERRVTNNVYNPLHTEIIQEEERAQQAENAIRTDIPNQVMQLAPAIVAPALAGIAALATRVGVLEAEAESCGRPMCATMGPQTDLGKFLKALKIAEWAALLAELAALRAGGLDELLNEIEGWAKTAIGDFESVFFTGGKTLGETIASIV